MKKIIFIIVMIVVVILIFILCGGGEVKEEVVVFVMYNFDGGVSFLKWKGDYVDGIYSYEGMVKFSEVMFVFEGEIFKLGEVKVDFKIIDLELDVIFGEL